MLECHNQWRCYVRLHQSVCLRNKIEIMNTNRLTFDRQLGSLRDQVLHMSEMVEQAILLSSRALQGRDLALAQQINDFDTKIIAHRFIIESVF